MRDISTTTEFLSKVGDTRIVTSDNYGKYVMRCVANIDWFPQGVDANEYFAWSNKHHPKKFAASYILDGDPTPGVERRYVSFFVALEDDNAQWFDQNRNCAYLVQTKRRRCKLPVATSKKAIERFLAASTKFLL